MRSAGPKRWPEGKIARKRLKREKARALGEELRGTEGGEVHLGDLDT
jgi:hypothetical protein